MSQENVELARHFYAVLNAEGFNNTENLVHPDIEFIDSPTLPDASRYVGEAAVRGFGEEAMERGWDGHWWVQEILDAGDEVVVVWQMRGRSAHGGGFPFDETVAHVCLFEDGKVRRVRAFLSRAEALEAAGLEE
jgi:ketosteroid isomerase-like protein